MIPNKMYNEILSNLPILCVDIIIMNNMGQYLLVKRANEPLKNEWWIVGGRVKKGETIKDAAIRKVWEELSLQINDLEPIGIYEGFFEKSNQNISGGVHTVSVVFVTKVHHESKQIDLDDQSLDWKYSNKLPPDFAYKPFSVPNEV